MPSSARLLESAQTSGGGARDSSNIKWRGSAGGRRAPPSPAAALPGLSMRLENENEKENEVLVPDESGKPPPLDSSPIKHVEPLDLPRGTVEIIAYILTEATDQLTILSEISRRQAHESDRKGIGSTASLRSFGGPSSSIARIHTGAGRGKLDGPLTVRGGGSGDLPPKNSDGRIIAAGGHHHDLVKTSRERAALQVLLTKCVQELREGHVTSLVRAVNEDKAKRNLLHDAMEREKEASVLLRDLQRQLTEETQQLEQERKERDVVIQQLREAIQEIQVLTVSEQKYLKKETRAHESSVRQQHLHQEVLLTEHQTHLERALAMEQRSHAMVVDFLNRQRKQLEEQIQTWMDRHEGDTERAAQAMDMLRANRTQDLDRYEELVSQYEALERVVEEHKNQQAKDQEERRANVAARRRTRAATSIQKWYRAKKGWVAGKAAAGAGGAAGRKSASGTNRKGASSAKKAPASASSSTAKKKSGSASKK